MMKTSQNHIKRKHEGYNWKTLRNINTN